MVEVSPKPASPVAPLGAEIALDSLSVPGPDQRDGDGDVMMTALERSPSPSPSPLLLADQPLVLPTTDGSRSTSVTIGRFASSLFAAYPIEQQSNSVVRSNHLAMVQLDGAMAAMGPPSSLQVTRATVEPFVLRDPRLLEHQNRLFVAFQQTSHSNGAPASTQMHLAEVDVAMRSQGAGFSVVRHKRLVLSGQKPQLVDCTWAPFSKGGRLHFVYRSNPQAVAVMEANEWETAGDDIALKRLKSDGQHIAMPWDHLVAATSAGLTAQGEHFLLFSRAPWPSNSTASQLEQTQLGVMGAYLFASHAPFSRVAMTYAPLLSWASLETAWTGSGAGRRLVWDMEATGWARDDEGRLIVSYRHNQQTCRIMVLNEHALLQLMQPVPPSDASNETRATT